MSREDPQLKLRLPPALKDRITKAASDNGRSVNAEILARLERSFEDDETISELYTRVDKIEDMVYLHDEILNPGKYNRK